LDSVSFGRYLNTLWEPSAGLTVAAFRYDSVGAVDTAFVHSEAMTPSTKQRLTNSLAEFARPGGEARESVSLFLGDDAGPALRRVSELRTCEPELINERAVADMLLSEARGLLERNLLPDFGRRVTFLWMMVEPEGHVSQIRVHESAGRVEVDEAAVRIMRNARFNPARVEGIVIPAWVQIPIRFQVVSPPPPRPLPPPPRR
jgi:TonB family protein